MNKLGRVGCLIALIVPAVPASAQVNRASLSRPSSGPSTRVGQIGGVLTRARATEGAYTDVRNRRYSDPGSGIAGAATFGLGFRGVRRAEVPAAFDIADLGYGRFYPGQSIYVNIGRSSPGDSLLVSRYGASMSMTVPLGGIGKTSIPIPSTPFFAPPEPRSAFHDFYGLTPSPKAEADPTESAAASTAVYDPAALFEKKNAEIIDLRMRNARQALHEVLVNTKAIDEEVARQERMSRLIGTLSGVRALEKQDYLPCLMLLHLTLEKNQPIRSLQYLFDVVERNPNFFAEPPDLAEIFGSREFLEEQARRFIRIGDTTPGEPAGYALQAYCAWVLGDLVRVRESLQRVEELNATDARSEEAESLRIALGSALK